MTDPISRQADNILPPRWGKILAFTANTTSKAYDLSSVDLGTEGDLVAQNIEAGELYVDLISNGDCYFCFSDNSSAAVDKTAAIAAHGTVAFTANAAEYLVSGQRLPLRINRRKDRYFVVIADSGTPIVRMHVSSHAMGSVKEMT